MIRPLLPAYFAAVAAWLFSCEAPAPANPAVSDPDLSFIQLPEGFVVEYFAKDVPGARSIAMGDDGTVYISTRGNGKVYALPDKNGDAKADTVITLLSDMNYPNGVAWRDGDLYIAEINRVLVIRDMHGDRRPPFDLEVVYDGYPEDRHHGWKFIRFGPDGLLYVPVGAPCNICHRPDNPYYASITRLNVQTGQAELFASGIRNTVGFDWHPTTGDLWFSDNGGDNLGDNIPPEELNRADGPGLHFGYPFCHGGDIPDPEFRNARPCSDFTPPELRMPAHVAALGIRFNRSETFPESMKGRVFIAEHGSWNRTHPIGYRVTMYHPDDTASYAVFADGWLVGNEKLGRPVDVDWLPDGSMLLTDDMRGCVYRIVYQP